MIKFILGVLVGGLIAGIMSGYCLMEEDGIGTSPKTERTTFEGPGVIKICEESIHDVDCENKTLDKLLVAPGRYGLWIKK